MGFQGVLVRVHLCVLLLWNQQSRWRQPGGLLRFWERRGNGVEEPLGGDGRRFIRLAVQLSTVRDGDSNTCVCLCVCVIINSDVTQWDNLSLSLLCWFVSQFQLRLCSCCNTVLWEQCNVLPVGSFSFNIKLIGCGSLHYFIPAKYPSLLV